MYCPKCGAPAWCFRSGDTPGKDIQVESGAVHVCIASNCQARVVSGIPGSVYVDGGIRQTVGGDLPLPSQGGTL